MNADDQAQSLSSFPRYLSLAAVVTPMTGWLFARFVMTLGLLSFSIATFLCGLAQSLDALVLWRIIQGATGAPVVPLSQTILLNTFPPPAPEIHALPGG